jgi:hypothetical protein
MGPSPGHGRAGDLNALFSVHRQPRRDANVSPAGKNRRGLGFSRSGGNNYTGRYGKKNQIEANSYQPL